LLLLLLLLLQLGFRNYEVRHQRETKSEQMSFFLFIPIEKGKRIREGSQETALLLVLFCTVVHGHSTRAKGE
jgi:hypothetical protein